LVHFRDLALGDLAGDVCVNLCGSFPFDSHPKSMS
jgi:hypothetical protein